MADHSLTTQHIRPGMFHFLRMEILGVIFTTSFVMFGFIVPVILLFDAHLLVFFGLSLFFIPPFAFIFIAFSRAKFIRQGGYCVITPDKIKAICNGKVKEYEYKGRYISTRKRKQNSMDIYIGRSPIDLVRFGIGRKFFRTWLVVVGLPAPLYNVANVDEVLEYLKRHN